MHDALKATKKKKKNTISSLTKMILIMSFSAVKQPYQTVPFFQWPGQPLNSALQEVIEARKKKKKFTNEAERESQKLGRKLRLGIKSPVPYSVSSVTATEPRQKLHSSSSKQAITEWGLWVTPV